MAAKYVNIHANMPNTVLQKKLFDLIGNKEVMRKTHEILGEMCNDYVPLKSGGLRESMQAYPKSVKWKAPYAKYQYEGEVYGPNWVGYTSPSTWEWRTSKSKHKMGRKLGENPGERLLKPRFGKRYNTEPILVKFGYTKEGTTHHWFDEAMKNGGRRTFSLRVTNMLKAEAKKRNKTW